MEKLKYSNKITWVDGLRFDSKAEAKQYGVLKMRKRANDFDDFKCQVKFEIKVNNQVICTYIADFVTYIGDCIIEVVDVKGVKTPVYQLKKKLMKAVYGIDIVEIT